MRFEGRGKGRGPYTPPGNVKKRKKPSDEGIRDLGPKRDLGSMIDLAFAEKGGVLSAVLEGMPVLLSPESLKEVSSGETWKCMVQANVMTHRLEAFPCAFVSSAPAAVEKAPAGPAERPKREPMPEMPAAPAVTAPDSRQTMTIRQLKSDNERLEKENSGLREELRKMSGTNSVLCAQVNALNRKSEPMASLTAESEIMSLRDTVESQDLEISRLRKKLKSLGIDDLSVTPRLPKVPRATLTRPSTIRCTVLPDGRYTALVNPRKCMLRIIPDSDGRVACAGGTVHLGGLSMFSKFEKPRPLEMRELGDGIQLTI